MKELIVVTGAATGIGLGVARGLQANGFAVLGVDLNMTGGSTEFEIKKVDVSHAADIAALATEFRQRGWRLGGLVNNAALQIEKTAAQTDETELQQVFATNVFSIFHFLREFDNLWGARASIVNISSVHARATSKGLAAYAASKGAVSTLTRSMALEYGERGIRVNAICPGAIDTEMLKRGLGRNASPGDALKKLEMSSPLRKIGKPEDIAAMVQFLIDNKQSGNVTGQEFVVDGGVLAKLASE